MAATAKAIEIDGAYGEGGGGLLRSCLQMACLTQQTVQISNVRGGTNHPGLDLEDVLIAEHLAAACSARLEGCELASQRLVFSPTRRLGKIVTQESSEDRGGRGANALVVLSSLIAPIARSGCFGTVSGVGETYGLNTLTFDYFANVGIPALRRMGIYCWAEQETAGFGRENYGKVTLDCEPSAIEGVDWNSRGRLIGCHALVSHSNLPKHVAERGCAHLSNLANYSGVPLRIESRSVPGSGPGTAITLWCEFENGFGGSAQVGSRGLRVETVAQAAYETLADFLASDATVDPHLVDLLLVPAVLASGNSFFRVNRLTRRFLTMVWVVKQFLPIHLTILGEEGSPGEVSIRPAQ